MSLCATVCAMFAPRIATESRHGSRQTCDRTRDNWKLLQLPVRVVDYVIAHELAHLREPHHRPEFWRILDATLPDWRDRREELETRARDIYWCHERMAR